MRGLMSYILAGAVVLFAMGIVALPDGPGLAVVAQPAAEAGQFVDRTNKGDRLHVPTVNGRQTPTPGASPLPVGCEAVFSSLSAGARANFPGRCAS
jgi:hypothetical protein